MTSISPFQVNDYTHFGSATALSGYSITSTAPATGQALIFNSADLQFEYGTVLNPTIANTITGLTTFTGGVDIGSGSSFKNLVFGSTVTAAVVGAGGFQSVAITYSGFAATPIIVATAVGPSTAAYEGVSIQISSASATGANLVVSNSGAAPTAAAVPINYIIIGS